MRLLPPKEGERSVNTTVKNLLLKPLLMTLVYYLSGKVIFEFFHPDTIVTITPFAPEGIALAGALIFGWRIIPGIVAGQFLLAADMGLSPALALGIGLINGAEAYLAILLFRYLGLERRLLTLRDVVGLVVLILFVLQPFSAVAGNALLFFGGDEPIGSFWRNVFSWWFGNVMGQLLLTPLLLLLYRDRHTLRWRRFLAVFLFFSGLSWLLEIVLSVDSVIVLLMVTLPLTLALVTVDLVYAMFAAFVLTVSNLCLAHIGEGTFVHGREGWHGVLDLNYFMLNHILLVLFFGTLYKEKEEAIRRLRSMAHFDYLTGLPNRYLLREEIHHTVYLAHEKGAKGAICYFDLDGFKQVNDTMGHHVGDGVLKEVVRRLERFTRSEDTLLRIGGDEFLVIFNRIESRRELEEKLEKMLAAVAETIHVEGYEIRLSFSVGVAWCPDHGTRVEDLMGAADEAMYLAKKRGKNCFVFAGSTS